MPNELAIKLSFISEIINNLIDDYQVNDELYSKLIAASNSINEAEQSITSMVN